MWKLIYHYSKYMYKNIKSFVNYETEWYVLIIAVTIPILLNVVNLLSFIYTHYKYHNNDYSKYSRYIRVEILKGFIKSNFDDLDNIVNTSGTILEINEITNIL